MRKILASIGSLLFIVFQLHAQDCAQLIWADEFNGTTLNQNNWAYQIGDGCSEGLCGWGNNEQQYYRAENVTVSNGTLKLTAKQENFNSKPYTSGRIRTFGKASFKYGRMEARIKIPQGQGYWPAFWMLPVDEVYGGWPLSGEIDIMENVGNEPDVVHGTIHYGDAWPNNQYQGNSFTLESGTFADGFHTFAVDWTPNEIRWYVDDILYSVKTSSDISPYNWPFDQDFYIILNVAVGGTWPGSPNSSTQFPQAMEVDYVRVYNQAMPSLNGPDEVAYQAKGTTFSLANAPGNSTVNWSVPASATIVAGQGTSQVTIDWGTSGGTVTADLSSSCLTQSYTLDVTMEPPFSKSASLENFDEPATISLMTAAGSLQETSNPSPSGVNTSALSGMYIRSSSEQYDAITYSTASITDASEFVNKDQKFYMDVYTAAPVGSTILIQLESSASATTTNYPAGRHSRYQAVTTTQNQWERLEFKYVDSPDGTTPDTSVDRMVLLFAPNSYTSDTYYIDNLDVYSAQTALPEPEGGLYLENFDEPANVALTFTTGTLQETANPSPSGVNTSALSGQYVRNSAQQYDVMKYSTASITDASGFVSEQDKFYIDLYTAAPAGTTILLQLESSTRATAANYPSGRHSRFQAVTTTQNQWERLEFTYVDSPDGSTPDNEIDNIILLFAPDSYTSDTYYFDNLSVNDPQPFSDTNESLENFDEPASINLIFATGVLQEASNPSPSGINTSALSGQYARNSAQQYDVMRYTTTSVTDASEFVNNDKKFYMDVYTAAPAGSTIMLQLESSTRATTANYPSGRHSRYQAVTTTQNQWERLEFTYVDSPDGSTPDSEVDNIILLFAPDSYTSDTYYFDNLEINSPQAQTSIASNSKQQNILEADQSSLDKASLNVFPQPAEDKLKVFLPEKGEAVIKIYDTSGVLQTHRKLKNKSQLLELETVALKPGLYLMVIHQNGNHYTRKILIK